MAYTISRQECRDIKHTLRGMLRLLTEWTPKAKEGYLSPEVRQALADDAQSVIEALNQVFGDES